MSRTMKPEEAIRALAFEVNPEELVKSDVRIKREIRDDSFGKGLRGTLAKMLSETQLNLYATVGDNDKLDPGMEKTGKEMMSKRGVMRQKSAPGLSCDYEKGVCFGTVEVRKYPITIGENPSVSRGVPHTIEWDCIKEETETKTINAYERERPSEERKHGDDLVLDAITRAKMLKNLGYTKPELMEGVRKVNQCKTRRKSGTQFSGTGVSNSDDSNT